MNILGLEQDYRGAWEWTIGGRDYCTYVAGEGLFSRVRGAISATDSGAWHQICGSTQFSLAKYSDDTVNAAREYIRRRLGHNRFDDLVVDDERRFDSPRNIAVALKISEELNK